METTNQINNHPFLKSWEESYKDGDTAFLSGTFRYDSLQVIRCVSLLEKDYERLKRLLRSYIVFTDYHEHLISKRR